MGVLTENILCSVGLLFSCYAVFVEWKVHNIQDSDEPFSALCDIDMIGASCSNVFQLPEGKMLSYFGLVPNGSLFDVPNGVLGCIYYTYMLLLRNTIPRQLQTVNSPFYYLTTFICTMAFLSTVFLAYQLTFVLFELCILCWTTHFINTCLFYKNGIATHVLRTNKATKKDKKIS